MNILGVILHLYLKDLFEMDSAKYVVVKRVGQKRIEADMVVGVITIYIFIIIVI